MKSSEFASLLLSLPLQHRWKAVETRVLVYLASDLPLQAWEAAKQAMLWPILTEPLPSWITMIGKSDPKQIQSAVDTALCDLRVELQRESQGVSNDRRKDLL